MDWTYRSRAELRRAEAEEYRYLARMVSPDTDGQVLLQHAADLDKEAAKLERKADATATGQNSART